MTLYTVLGLNFLASSEDIKTRYRDMAAKEHPDAGGDEDRMAQINAAYQVLSDLTRRAQYDASLKFSHDICAECGGVGFIRHMRRLKMSEDTCPRCDGLGLISRIPYA
jgi:DnaJ-class molecular chaperone